MVPPSSTLPPLSDLDVAIRRAMYTASGVSVFGIDPRLNASRIGRQLGVGRARIAARLRAWADSGFLRRYDVWPNPFLFGLTGVSFDVRVVDRLGKPELFDRIGLLPGAVAGMDFLGEWILATFLVPEADGAAALRKLLAGFAGVAEVGEPIPWVPPPAGRPLSPLEVRIVRVLRRYPTASLASIARHVGVSTRTITTRYGQLLDRQAVWFLPVFDFRALSEPVASLIVQFASGGDRERFGHALRRSHPLSLEVARPAFGPVLPETVGGYFVVGRSAARLEDLEAWVRRSPGVRSFEALTMIDLRAYAPTLDRLLAGAPPALPPLPAAVRSARTAADGPDAASR